MYEHYEVKYIVQCLMIYLERPRKIEQLKHAILVLLSRIIVFESRFAWVHAPLDFFPRRHSWKLFALSDFPSCSLCHSFNSFSCLIINNLMLYFYFWGINLIFIAIRAVSEMICLFQFNRVVSHQSEKHEIHLACIYRGWIQPKSCFATWLYPCCHLSNLPSLVFQSRGDSFSFFLLLVWHFPGVEIPRSLALRFCFTWRRLFGGFFDPGYRSSIWRKVFALKCQRLNDQMQNA